MVEAYSDGKKQVRIQKIQKGVAGRLAHLPAIQIIFIFLRTSTKIIQNFQRKRGCCIPPRPTPKLNNSLLKIGDSDKLDNMPISGFGRN